MWVYYNPNPYGLKVGDCAVRAVAKAFGKSWDTAFASIALQAYLLKDMPSSDAVWGALLRSKGFKRAAVPDSCPDCYTAEDFCRDHHEGTYVIAFGGHVATVVDGDLYDSWDSSSEIPMYYYYLEAEDGLQSVSDVVPTVPESAPKQSRNRVGAGGSRG